MQQPDDPGVNPFDWRDSEPMSWTKGLIYGAIVAAIIFCISVAWNATAKAHEWFTQKYNPVSKVHCCSGVDCFVIAEEKWWQEGKTIKVQWFDGNTYSIPINQALPSEDRQGRAAACVWGGRLQCFFLPVNG